MGQVYFLDSKKKGEIPFQYTVKEQRKAEALTLVEDSARSHQGAKRILQVVIYDWEKFDRNYARNMSLLSQERLDVLEGLL